MSSSPFQDTISLKCWVDKRIFENVRDDFFDFLFLLLVFTLNAYIMLLSQITKNVSEIVTVKYLQDHRSLVSKLS